MRKLGIALLLCLPLLVIGSGIRTYLMPHWYYSTAMIERGSASIEDLSQAFIAVAPKTPDVTFQNVRNTDLVAIDVRDTRAQPAADKANSIATAVIEKLKERSPQPPRILDPARPASIPTRPIVWATMLIYGVIGLFPATIGLIMIIVGSRKRTAVLSETPQIA